ncbi:hypothetical protein [Candidatus Nitrosotenuis aquarius]|uniref:hypothetical protein n=1 Tax=Candidatus Nitrosotenuis aquarius TaxID=1846278 RepID=UPI000C1F1DA5|nr:hypothetical protein [Candidatus Nitrosotenuis aquarius]
MSTYVKNEKTETITARISKKTLDKLRSYAKSENITINSAINQLLSHAMDWDVVAAKTGWIPIPKDVLMAYFERLDDKTIMEVADLAGQHVPKDMLLAMRGKTDAEEWISVLRSRAKAAGFHFSEIVEDDFVKFVMKHDMGLKWSIYFQTYYDSAFRALGAPVTCSITNNTISYTIDKKYYDPEKN